MAAGDIRAYGSATVAAGTPGAAGTIAVANAAIAATDRIVATISDTSIQDVSTVTKKDISFQIVKEAGVGFSVTANQRQNPSFKVDYLVFEGA